MILYLVIGLFLITNVWAKTYYQSSIIFLENQMIELIFDPQIPKEKLNRLNEIEIILSKIGEIYKVEENISIIFFANSDLGHFRSFLS